MGDGNDIGKTLTDFQKFAANTMAVGLKVERAQAATRCASEMASAWISARHGLQPDEKLLREFARLGVMLVDAVAEECRKPPPGAQAVTPEQLAALVNAPQPPEWVSEVLAEEMVADSPDVIYKTAPDLKGMAENMLKTPPVDSVEVPEGSEPTE